MADKREQQIAPQAEDEMLHEDIAKVLEGIPTEKRQSIERLFVSQFAMVSGRTSPEFEISKKVTSEHIGKMLDTQQQAMEFSYKDEKNKRLFYVILIVIVCAVVLGIVLILKDQPETMEKVLIGLGGVITGAVGGYGYRASKEKDQ